MYESSLFVEPTIFDLQTLTKIMFRNNGWNVFEESYNKEYDTYTYGIEYLLDDNKFDNTTSYDVTVSYGRKDYYGNYLDHAVKIGTPVKR